MALDQYQKPHDNALNVSNAASSPSVTEPVATETPLLRHTSVSDVAQTTVLELDDAKQDGSLATVRNPHLEKFDQEKEAYLPTDVDNKRTPSFVPFDTCLQKLRHLQLKASELSLQYATTFKKVLRVFLAIGFLVFLVFACIHDVTRALPLLVVTACVLLQFAYNLAKKRLAQCWRYARPPRRFISDNWRFLKWPVYASAPLGLAIFLVLDVGTEAEQYMPLCGLFVFLLILYCISVHRSKVSLRPVAWGFIIQFTLAILVLRTYWGFYIFRLIGVKAHQFLSYADVGSRFVFGENFTQHPFAFQVLPVVIYFSAVISVLYHVGVMQAVIRKLAWFMQLTMHTSATESLVAASNIFIGQTEAPILVKPFITDMTMSEIHAMMTAGYATIAGGVLAAYIIFGVPAEHLICASVMNAPIALAVSKIVYPETEKSKTTNKSIPFNQSTETNLIEAAASGASQAIPLVLNIAANLIAFLAILAFVNTAMTWLGGMVGCPQLSFQLVCSYLFWPFALLMGVERQDCFTVAELLGTKTFLNEFVAYKEMAKLAQNRQTCVQPYISPRSEIIATYALCGFANLSSMGIQIGGIGALAPSRRSDLSKLALRALVAGTMACFITASVASVLTAMETDWSCHVNGTLSNVTAMATNETSTVSVIDYTL